MINMTDIHNTIMGLNKILPDDKKKKKGSSTSNNNNSSNSNNSNNSNNNNNNQIKKDTTIHAVVSEKVTEILQLVDHEEKANKAMELVKNLMEKIQLLEASRNRNREYQLLLEKRIKEMTESVTDNNNNTIDGNSTGNTGNTSISIHSNWGASTK